MNSTHVWKKNFRVLWLSQFLAIAGLTVLVPLLPIYISTLGDLSMGEIQFWSGLAIAAPALTTMISSPFWGKLGDRISRKWMILRALFGLSLCLFLMAFAATPLQFVFIRLLQGLFGGVVEASNAFATSEAPETEQGHVLGKLQSSVSAGSLVGPLIGGVAATIFGFSSLMMGIAILTFIACLFGMKRLTETEHPKLQEASQVKGSVKQSYCCLLSSQITCRFIIVGVLANFAMYGMITALAPLTSSVNHTFLDDKAAVGLLQSAFWMASIISAPLWGYLNDKRHVKNVYLIATMICGVSVILQGLATHLWILLAFRILQGLTYSALIQSVMFVVVNASHNHLKGTFVGATNSILVIGQIVGSMLGALITSTYNPVQTFIWMGVIFAASSVVLMSTHLSPIKEQKMMNKRMGVE